MGKQLRLGSFCCRRKSKEWGDCWIRDKLQGISRTMGRGCCSALHLMYPSTNASSSSANRECSHHHGYLQIWQMWHQWFPYSIYHPLGPVVPSSTVCGHFHSLFSFSFFPWAAEMANRLLDCTLTCTFYYCQRIYPRTPKKCPVPVGEHCGAMDAYTEAGHCVQWHTVSMWCEKRRLRVKGNLTRLRRKMQVC